MRGKIIDEHGRLFGKVSVIDLVALALILAAAVLIYVRFFAPAEPETDDTQPPSVDVGVDVDVTYTVRLSQVREGSVNAIRVGDELCAPADGTIYGVITQKRVEPATILSANAAGEVQRLTVEGAFDVILTVEGEAVEHEDGRITVGALELAVNNGISFYTKYVNGSGFIRSVERS